MASQSHQYRRNSSRGVLVGLISLGLIGVLLVFLNRWTAKPTIKKDNLVVYCAAGIRKPVEAAAKQYGKEYNVEIRLDYGSSGELESRLALEHETGVARCDLYIPADFFFSNRARTKGLTQESIPLAKQEVVVAIKPNAKAGFSSVKEMLEQKVPFVVCNEQAGVGKKTKDQLEQHSLWGTTAAQRKVSFPRVPEAANAVKTSADIQAGMLWNSTARQFGLQIVPCPELTGSEATISADVTTTTTKPKAALHFARYLAAPEKGKPLFERFHFDPIPGDPWVESPELVVYCGGVNRNAIATTLADFEAREGCIIKTHYAGCGTIVGNIKAGKFTLPDAFMTCDASYLTMVEGDFQAGADVSSTRIVIMVRKGNPKQIQGLKDLAQPGVTVGTTDPQMSTLGALSHQLFDDEGVRPALQTNQNIIVTTPTAHELILQMEGHTKLDAALVYEANCQHLTDRFELVPLPQSKAKAVQNIAVGKESQYPQLSGRLLNAVFSQTSKDRFLGEGFAWEAVRETP